MLGIFSKKVREYKIGYKLYSSKQYEEAFPHLQYAAEKGHVEAQFLIGDCYDYGYGIAMDTDKSTDWYEKAAAGGHAEAQYRLGMMYADVMGMLALARYNSQKPDQDKIHTKNELFDGIASAFTKWASDPKETSSFIESYKDAEEKTKKWLGAAARQGHKSAQEEYKDLFG